MELRDLKIGNFVRTKSKACQPSQIARITNISKDSGYKNQEYITLDKNLIPNYEYYVYKEDIIKASDKLIDLLEIGDYVNGVKVTKITSNDYIELDYSYNRRCCYNEDIKSIVTKEIFDQMSYKVGE